MSSPAGFPISRELKEIRVPNGDDRLARAMEMANAYAFHLKLDLNSNASVFADEHVSAFKDLLGDVNEYASVDIRKAVDLFKKLIAIRYDLVNGGVSPELIKLALTSSAAADGLTEKEGAMAACIESCPDFVRRQSAIQAVLSQFYPN